MSQVNDQILKRSHWVSQPRQTYITCSVSSEAPNFKRTDMSTYPGVTTETKNVKKKQDQGVAMASGVSGYKWFGGGNGRIGL